MTIEVTDLDSLDSTEVQEALLRSRTLIAEKYPDRRVRGGAFEELVLRADALLGTVHRTNFDRLRDSQSLSAIAADATLSDDEVLDALASNYRLERTAGSYASGSVTLIVSTNLDTIIATGALFTASNGVVFETSTLFTGRGSALDVLTDNDRLMVSLSDGTYAFMVDVTAQTIGTDGNLAAFSTLTVASPPVNFVRAYVAASFTGGVDEESTESLQTKLQTGIAHKSLCSRSSIEGVIRADAAYADIVGTSIVGYGDPEQVRYHSIFPVAHGGRVDAYVRTTLTTTIVALTKTATLINADGTWQVSFTRDEAPGFYEVTKILLPTMATDEDGFELVSDVRGYDSTVTAASIATPGTAFIPDIEAASEAAYSRYQTAIVQFLDTATDVAELVVGSSTASYVVYVRLLEGLDAVQDLLADRAVRSPCGDCLVKAPVPCFTSAVVSINKKSSDDPIDTGAIQQAVIDAINTVGFTGKLPASRVVSAAETGLAEQGALNSSVAQIALTGRIRRPDGTEVTQTSSTVLSVTDEPTKMVTGRTVAFIAELDDITVTVTSVDVPEV